MPRSIRWAMIVVLVAPALFGLRLLLTRTEYGYWKRHIWQYVQAKDLGSYRTLCTAIFSVGRPSVLSPLRKDLITDWITTLESFHWNLTFSL
jgi:hypothetical protein